MDVTDTSQFWTELDAAQRKLLQMSIHLNPMLVAFADGNCTMRETAALAVSVRALLEQEEYNSLVAVAGSEVISEAALGAMLQTHQSDLEAYLRDLAQILTRMPKSMAEAYRRFAIFSIMRVAQASCDGLLGLIGRRINASEKAVIQRMVEVLELRVDDDAKRELGML